MPLDPQTFTLADLQGGVPDDTYVAQYLERALHDPAAQRFLIEQVLAPKLLRPGDTTVHVPILPSLSATLTPDPVSTITDTITETETTVTVRATTQGDLSLPVSGDALKLVQHLSDEMTAQANMRMLEKLPAMLPIGGPPPPSWPDPQTIGAGALSDPGALRQYRQELLRQFGAPDPPMTGVPMPPPNGRMPTSTSRADRGVHDRWARQQAAANAPTPRWLSRRDISGVFGDGLQSPYNPAFRDFMAAAGCGPTCSVGTHFDIEQLESVYWHSSGPGAATSTLRMPDILRVARTDQAEYILHWLRALHDGSICELCGAQRDPDAEPIVLEVPEPEITVKLNGQLFEYRNGHVSPYPVQTQVEACSRPCATAYAMKLDMRRPPPRAHLDPERRRAREEARDAALEQLASRDSEPVVDTPLWDIWRPAA